PVGGEAEKLLVDHELTAQKAKVLGDYRLHLIEEQLPGESAEEVKGFLQAGEESPHVLTREEAQPQQSGVAEYHEQGVALPPGELELREVNLRLMGGRRLEAHHRLRCWPGTHVLNVDLELRVAAGVARRLDLLKESDGGKRWKGAQALLDQRLEGVELRRHRLAGAVLDGAFVEVSIELTLPNPAVEGVRTDSELSSQSTLAHALLQVVSQQHPCLASDQGRLRQRWRHQVEDRARDPHRAGARDGCRVSDFHPTEVSDLRPPLTGFWKLWETELWRESLQRAVYW